ncbi:hypothetical protein [Clostridium sp. MF28]|uniref:hypothetical protein n=1 Tax=Clostridium sp. MF28 TaxID=1702238 RepID=UPI001FAAEE5A|nr:hypothetical protein [Clostridium sp. MF28]
MNKNLKRIASIIMTVTMVSASMIGCGNSTSQTSGGSASGKTKLTLWHTKRQQQQMQLKHQLKGLWKLTHNMM